MISHWQSGGEPIRRPSSHQSLWLKTRADEEGSLAMALCFSPQVDRLPLPPPLLVCAIQHLSLFEESCPIMSTAPLRLIRGAFTNSTSPRCNRGSLSGIFIVNPSAIPSAQPCGVHILGLGLGLCKKISTSPPRVLLGTFANSSNNDKPRAI